MYRYHKPVRQHPHVRFWVNLAFPYIYNPDGLRTSKTVDGVTTKHIWSGSEMVLDTTGTDVVKYVRGIGLIASVNSAGTKKYNAHSDVTMLTNATGAVLRTYDTNPFRYCGEYYDEETGSYHLRARYYQPKLGRFMSQDTAKDGLN